MKRIKTSPNGFTLIELLVVIVIIGSLAAVAVPNFMAARERARDAQRKSDIKQIQKALELYKLDQSSPAYPATGAIPSPGSPWTNGAGTTTYMNKVPGDPNPTPGAYSYALNASDSLKYTLCACIENKVDPDPGVSAGDCTVAYDCSTDKKYSVSEP